MHVCLYDKHAHMAKGMDTTTWLTQTRHPRHVRRLSKWRYHGDVDWIPTVSGRGSWATGAHWRRGLLGYANLGLLHWQTRTTWLCTLIIDPLSNMYLPRTCRCKCPQTLCYDTVLVFIYLEVSTYARWTHIARFCTLFLWFPVTLMHNRMCMLMHLAVKYLMLKQVCRALI